MAIGIFITNRHARSAAMPVLFLLSCPKMGFSPHRGDMFPDKREIWHWERTADQRSAPLAKFHVYRGRNVGIQPTKLSKFRILAINFPLRGHSFAQFLQNYRVLYASTGSFLSIFPRWGHFPAKFQKPLAAKLLIGSKKVRGTQNWDGPPLSPCQAWWGS